MRSATSYFNGTLYRKTMARFWPLWALYGVIWLFALPLNMLTTYFSRYMSSPPQRRLLELALGIPDLLSIGLFLAAFFAILCAMAVFGYLYNSRSACWTHALPLRREALFTTQYLVGLSFLLLPQLAVAVLTAVVELSFLPMSSWGEALFALAVWLLAQSGMCLFFFSFAAFCAMFTGHILALPVFYCILNVLASVVFDLLDALFHQFFFGYTRAPGPAQAAVYLTPALALENALNWWEDSPPHLSSSGTIALYAAVGVLLALASLSVYRRRHIETAGDVVAVPLVRPLFKYGVSFCSGLCFGMFTAAFFGYSSPIVLIPCILFWAAIGYFAAEMLLKKSFRVFRAWKGAAVMTAVMFLLCIGCFLDLFGVAARVPKADQVEKMLVSLEMGSPGDTGRILFLDLTAPEDIQKFLALHQAVVDDRDRMDSSSSRYEASSDYTHLRLEYTLKGGASMERSYSSLPLYQEDLDREGSFTNLVQAMIENRELVKQAYGFDSFLKNARLTGAWLDRLYNSRGEMEYNIYLDDYAQELWDAVQADFAEGTIGVRYLFDSDPERLANTCRTDLNFSVTAYRKSDGSGSVQVSPNGYDIDRTITITLTPNARHTLAALDKTGIWEEGYSLAHYNSDGEKDILVSPLYDTEIAR